VSQTTSTIRTNSILKNVRIASPSSENGIDDDRLDWLYLTIGFGKHLGEIPVTKQADAALKNNWLIVKKNGGRWK